MGPVSSGPSRSFLCDSDVTSLGIRIALFVLRDEINLQLRTAPGFT